MAELLRIDNLSKSFFGGSRSVKAVDRVSLALSAGETVGIVGASGSGKSTLSRLLLRLVEPDEGSILFRGEDWLSLRGRELRQKRAGMQMVFQDPLSAFHPSATAAQAIIEPLRIHDRVPREERLRKATELLQRVGLSPDDAIRSVRSLSGGQRQRVAIARALASEPALLVLDEAVSALDPTIRETILELLVSLQEETGLAYLFISHDLAVTRAVSHRIAVMDGGRIVEIGDADDVVFRPRSEAARKLVAAVPRLQPRMKTEGSPS
ncbi:ABC transporter ATP-binding protein [Oryzifoliimicrobium ureilyticus]|uniref:ABC transporter ATP-binding protein n=1 Tax=Oryzifoliimicrobium ureilyticus TaxID=3113724 RepID=UPI0030768804